MVPDQIAALAERHAPADLALVQIDGGQMRVRRLVNRQAFHEGQRRAAHVDVVGVGDLREGVSTPVGIALVDLEQRRVLGRLDEQQAGFRIEGRAAPVRAPRRGRTAQRAAERRRRYAPHRHEGVEARRDDVVAR